MMDLLNQDAASWDSTPLHDDHFLDNHESEEGSPSQFVKFVAEMAIENDLNIATINQGNLN